MRINKSSEYVIAKDTETLKNIIYLKCTCVELVEPLYYFKFCAAIYIFIFPKIRYNEKRYDSEFLFFLF